jgi:dTMP kinase
VLLALEGIDGSGKSTLGRRLAEALRAQGYTVSLFREPGDSEFGAELRRIFVEGRDVTPEEEMKLFLEDRRLDVRDNIGPALERGEVVIMDRYYLSSVVYQGALGLDPAMILAANLEIAPEPDLTVVFDLDPAVALRRIRAARGDANTFEDASYLTSVRELYRRYVDGDRVQLLDAARDFEPVLDELVMRVSAFLESRADL